jgi:hypothetical protein
MSKPAVGHLSEDIYCNIISLLLMADYKAVNWKQINSWMNAHLTSRYYFLPKCITWWARIGFACISVQLLLTYHLCLLRKLFFGPNYRGEERWSKWHGPGLAIGAGRRRVPPKSISLDLPGINRPPSTETKQPVRGSCTSRGGTKYILHSHLGDFADAFFQSDLQPFIHTFKHRRQSQPRRATACSSEILTASWGVDFHIQLKLALDGTRMAAHAHLEQGHVVAVLTRTRVCCGVFPANSMRLCEVWLSLAWANWWLAKLIVPGRAKS